MYDTECLLRLLSFASSMYFGHCRSVFSRLGRVDLLLRWSWNLVILFVTFKEKSDGRILLARLADRFRSPWKQTSEERMALVFRSSDSPRSFLSICLARSPCTLRVLSYSTNLSTYPTSVLRWYSAIFKRGSGKRTDCDCPSVACRLESCTGLRLT
jgi:hypothetical protein